MVAFKIASDGIDPSRVPKKVLSTGAKIPVIGLALLVQTMLLLNRLPTRSEVLLPQGIVILTAHQFMEMSGR